MTKFRKILSVKKEARLSARALAEVDVGRGEEDLRCKSLFIVCQRCRGLSEAEETKLAYYCFLDARIRLW